MSLFLKILKWAGIFIFVGFAALVVYRMFVLWDKQKTDEQVAKIHATKLSLDDVMGKNLPPDPGADADKTIAGIDANHNGIRDDVELAIFKLHPDSARIRAAELQYAMALQMILTKDVSNSETFVEILHKEDRGSSCILEATRVTNDFNLVKKRQKEVEDLVSNTTARIQRRQVIFERYMTTYALPMESCDIDLTSLPN